MTKNYSIQEHGGDTANILKKSLVGLVEGLSGIAVSKKMDFQLSVGHLLQSLEDKGVASSFLIDSPEKKKQDNRVRS